MNVKQLHALCTAFPPIEEVAFAELVSDIQQTGLREPIVLLDDQVLDGRNRYHACLEAGVQARFRDFGSDIGDGTDPVAFVLSKNLRRRHLTASQQAAAVAKTQDWSAAHPAHRAKEVGTGADLSTARDRAALSGASIRTQTDADLIAREAPELLDKVIAGEVSAKAAAQQIRATKAQPNSVGESRPAASEHSDAQVPAGAVPTAPAIPASALEGPADGDDASHPTGNDADDAADALQMMAAELDAYRIAAAGNEESAKRILILEGQIRTLESQRNEWMTKANELVKTVKSLRTRLAKYERVSA